MRSQSTPGILFGAVVAASLALTGCATSPSANSPDPESDSGLQVVASTNVYGSIASAVVGDLATVTSIITSAAQDPHSYEASAQDQLALANADLVIENGGGYDPFIDTLLDASDNREVAVVNASESSGLIDGGAADHDDHESEDEHAESEEAHDEHAHIEGFNEHVWYSFNAVGNIAEEIAHELGELDADNAAAYEENYEVFAAELDALEEMAHGLESQADGLGVATTEPVPVYLLEAVGLENRTPAEFSEAIEEGTDVSPSVLLETLDLFSDDSVAVLAYNEQTAGPETEQVREAAEAAGVAVVSFTETLPEGADYISWMTENLEALSTAIS